MRFQGMLARASSASMALLPTVDACRGGPAPGAVELAHDIGLVVQLELVDTIFVTVEDDEATCAGPVIDLHGIEDAFVRVLSAIHHGRVKYPGDAVAQQQDSGENGATGSGDSGEENSTAASVTARRR